MKIKYVPFFTENIEEQKKFFCEILDFKAAGKIHLDEEGTTGLLMQKDNKGILIVLTDNKHYENSNCTILSTDDCLKDYHRLRSAGGISLKEPHYLSAGLAAEFTDQFNNRFVLLEERDYNEDI